MLADERLDALFDPLGGFGDAFAWQNTLQRAAPLILTGLAVGIVAAFANIDEIYETSASFTPQFQFLEPQRAWTYELGIALGRTLPWLQISAFHMDVTNEIRLDPYSSGVGNRNMPPLQRTGVDGEATTVPMTRARYIRQPLWRASPGARRSRRA